MNWKIFYHNLPTPFPLVDPVPVKDPCCWLNSHTGFSQHSPGSLFSLQYDGMEGKVGQLENDEKNVSDY